MVSAVVMAADCVARLVLPERSAVPCYAPVGCLALVFAMWGGARESRGLWDTFRMAATDDEPPYLVTETEKGACKQAGSVPGFYTTALRENTAAVWQNALMPVVLMASIVFAGLSSLGQERGDDFLLNWSAILGAGTTFALPLCWGMPFSRLARHFHKAGCAVAGWLKPLEAKCTCHQHQNYDIHRMPRCSQGSLSFPSCLLHLMYMQHHTWQHLPEFLISP